MTTIFLVRHGQTTWNRARIFRGRAEVRLSELGRKEAECVARSLADAPIRQVYTSPLHRARETADIVAEPHGAEVIPDPAFIDIDFGGWTEFWEFEVERRFPKEYELWRTAPHLVRFPRGESLDDVRRRAVARLYELAAARKDEQIALVSHRVVLKLLLCEARGLDNTHFNEMRVATGAICRVDSADGSLRVVEENRVCHLPHKPLE